MLFVPSIDGFAQSFQFSATKIPIPVYGCQYSQKVPSHSIAAVGQYLANAVLKTLKPKHEVLLCGHSFGTMVGYYMCKHLEDNDVQVQLIFIDGRPNFPSWYSDLDMEHQTNASIASNFLQMLGVQNDVLDLEGNVSHDEIVSKKQSMRSTHKTTIQWIWLNWPLLNTWNM